MRFEIVNGALRVAGDPDAPPPQQGGLRVAAHLVRRSGVLTELVSCEGPVHLCFEHGREFGGGQRKPRRAPDALQQRARAGANAVGPLSRLTALHVLEHAGFAAADAVSPAPLGGLAALSSLRLECTAVEDARCRC